MNIGSVMMDGEEELVMPTIPIRPNNAIPVAIGILLILGSLGGAILSLTYAFSNSIDDEIILTNIISSPFIIRYNIESGIIIGGILCQLQ